MSGELPIPAREPVIVSSTFVLPKVAVTLGLAPHELTQQALAMTTPHQIEGIRICEGLVQAATCPHAMVAPGIGKVDRRALLASIDVAATSVRKWKYSCAHSALHARSYSAQTRARYCKPHSRM